MNQLDTVREILKVYEKKRDSLRGLDDLTAGIDILVCCLESSDILDRKIIAKNMLITCQRESFKWVNGVLKNHSVDSSDETRTLNYCDDLMNEFEEANKLIGTESEFDQAKQLIEERLNKINFPMTDTIMSIKLTDEEISLLIKLGILPEKSRMRP